MRYTGDEYRGHGMQSSMDKDDFDESRSAAAASEPAVIGERVFTEPVDESGIILIETRIAQDGTKRTRKITRKGWPVLSLKDRLKMKSTYPPEPD